MKMRSRDRAEMETEGKRSCVLCLEAALAVIRLP